MFWKIRIVDPYVAEFSLRKLRLRVTLFLENALTGLEAEAMIKNYGGDLFNPVESAPLAATHPASFFCVPLPVFTGLNLPPEFIREFDRVR